MPIIHNVPQLSARWFQLRAGIPTSSMNSSLVTPTGRPSASMYEYAKTLAYEVLHKKPDSSFKGNKSTERGQLLEPAAIGDYEFITGNKVTPVGFITDTLMRCGASTDGLVGDKGAIEVKCLEWKAYVTALLHYHETGKVMDDRVPQVQGEIHVGEFDWVDVVYYYPDFPTIIIKVFPDRPFIEILKTQINAVICERDRIVRIVRET